MVEPDIRATAFRSENFRQARNLSRSSGESQLHADDKSTGNPKSEHEAAWQIRNAMRRSRSSSSSPSRPARPNDATNVVQNAPGKPVCEDMVKVEIQDERAAIQILKRQKDKLVSKSRRLQGAIRCARWESEDAEEACEEATRHYAFWEDHFHKVEEQEKLEQQAVQEALLRPSLLETYIPRLQQEVAEAERSAEVSEERRSLLVDVGSPKYQDTSMKDAVSMAGELQRELRSIECAIENVRHTQLIPAQEVSDAQKNCGKALRILNPEILEAVRRTEGLRAERHSHEEGLLQRHRESEARLWERLTAQVQVAEAELVVSRADHTKYCFHAENLATSVTKCHEEQRSLSEKKNVALADLKKARERYDGAAQERLKQSMEMERLGAFAENHASESEMIQEDTREAKRKTLALCFENERMRANLEISSSNHNDRLHELHSEMEALKIAGAKMENDAREEGLRKRDLLQNELRTRTVEVKELQCEHTHVVYYIEDLQKQIRQCQHECCNEQRTTAVLLSDIGRVQAELSAERVSSRNAKENVAEVRDALLQSESEASVLKSTILEFQQHLAEVREAAEAAAAARFREEMLQAKPKKTKSKERRGSSSGNLEHFEKALQALVSQEVATLKQQHMEDETAIPELRQERSHREKEQSNQSSANASSRLSLRRGRQHIHLES
eukprot:gnl/MRDRNA2_/MRDRNA2_99626_c0_seq1.p1 gnl/MRDRNA2_/MRDRNA2_99626_c0~~gnl/MRDRNA2_/MRDRNA2_99626_c0_seq1.p1  ORF type:complete len:675 (+),score=176.49 gnl/MRDRNA2_/MRDRNA2_99626_c0_seq1:75-2099(+)